MVDCNVNQSSVVDCGFTAARALLRDGYPCRWQVIAVTDCSVDESICCGGLWVSNPRVHAAARELLRDGYPCQCEVTAVVDCSVDQSAVVEWWFTGAWSSAAF